MAFLDSDDRLLPRGLECGAKYLMEHPQCAFVHGDYRRIAEDGSPRHITQTGATDNPGYVGLLQKNYIAMHGTVLYRSDTLRGVGGFDASLPACEDYDVYLRIARTHDIGYQACVIAEVRDHGDSMSRNAALMLQTSLHVLRSQERFVRGNEELEQAFNDGVKFWRGLYGEQLLASVAGGHGNLRDNFPGKVVVLTRYYPGAFRSALRHAARKLRVHLRRSPLGVRFGSLRKLSPVSRNFGFERGTPVDRYYIEAFLAQCSGDVRGRVLEVADNSYTVKFGGKNVCGQRSREPHSRPRSHVRRRSGLCRSHSV